MKITKKGMESSQLWLISSIYNIRNIVIMAVTKYVYLSVYLSVYQPAQCILASFRLCLLLEPLYIIKIK